MFYDDTEELRNWILEEETSFNKVMKALNSFNDFIEAVKSVINTLNYCYDFLQFKTKNINFKDLYSYFKNFY